MTIDLDRKDLIALVRGTSPNFSEMNNPKIKKHGSWVGGHHDRWDWNFSSIENASDAELIELYKICKDSWINAK